MLWLGNHLWLIYALLGLGLAALAFRFRAVWWPPLVLTFRRLGKVPAPAPKIVPIASDHA